MDQSKKAKVLLIPLLILSRILKQISLMMRHFSELMVTLSCQPWLSSMEKMQRKRSHAIINKEELLGEWQVL